MWHSLTYMEVKKHISNSEATYPFTVAYARPGYLQSKGFGKVGDLPFIFDDRPRYHRIGNRFLIDLGTGTWSIRYQGRQPDRPPARATMRIYAFHLANYLQFCKERSVEPLETEYLALTQQYQGAMANGTWSASGEALSPKTINARVDVAVMFLTWAADKGLRNVLHVPVETRVVKVGRAHSSGASSKKEVEARRGKMRESKRKFGFPDERVIAAWLQRLRDRCTTEGLIAELIIESAIRREEAACWREDTLPKDRTDWVINNQDKPVEYQSVLVTIRYGCKGHDFGFDHGDKIGPERSIHIPLWLANKLHKYFEKDRPHALKKLLKGARNGREAAALRKCAVHLFLRPEDGSRYTGQMIYDFWTSPSVDCPKGWHPHLARDFWACTMLWRHLQEESAALKRLTQSDPEKSMVDALLSKGSNFIQLVLKPQLGHISAETTMVYLQWVADLLKLNLNLMWKYDNSLPTPVDDDAGV